MGRFFLYFCYLTFDTLQKCFSHQKALVEKKKKKESIGCSLGRESELLFWDSWIPHPTRAPCALVEGFRS